MSPSFDCNEPSTLVTDGSSTEINTKEVPLGIKIDRALQFDGHVNSLCKKAYQKLNAIARFAPYMNVEKRRVIMKAFIKSQFGYCPLV